jgi:hypothetical protein
MMTNVPDFGPIIGLFTYIGYVAFAAACIWIGYRACAADVYRLRGQVERLTEALHAVESEIVLTGNLADVVTAALTSTDHQSAPAATRVFTDITSRSPASAAMSHSAGADTSMSVAPHECQHDWKVWPETDGQSQRCMKCGEFRDTPKEIKS